MGQEDSRKLLLHLVCADEVSAINFVTRLSSVKQMTKPELCI